MTLRRPYQGHIHRHCMLAATVLLFQGKDESPPSGPCSSPTVPGGCYTWKSYMERPWEQRLSLEQPVLVLSQNRTYSVPSPAPPSHHCILLPVPSQNSCRSWLCSQRLQNLCGDHEAVPLLEGQVWEQESQCPALPRYRDKDQPVPGARAMPCWKDPSQGSHQAPPQQFGAREVNPGDSEERGEIQIPLPSDWFPGSSKFA